MTKIVRLTESDLVRIVKRVINEQDVDLDVSNEQLFKKSTAISRLPRKKWGTAQKDISRIEYRPENSKWALISSNGGEVYFSCKTKQGGVGQNKFTPQENQELSKILCQTI